MGLKVFLQKEDDTKPVPIKPEAYLCVLYYPKQLLRKKEDSVQKTNNVLRMAPNTLIHHKWIERDQHDQSKSKKAGSTGNF